MTAAERPTGKTLRRDRAALAKLWGLLYRAVRRTSASVDRQQAALDALAAALDDLRGRVIDLEDSRERADETRLVVTDLVARVGLLTRRVDWLRARLVDAGVLAEGEGLP